MLRSLRFNDGLEKLVLPTDTHNLTDARLLILNQFINE
jgi:hypothetical protein